MLLAGAAAGADIKHSAVWVFAAASLLSACRLHPSLKLSVSSGVAMLDGLPQMRPYNKMCVLTWNPTVITMMYRNVRDCHKPENTFSSSWILRALNSLNT